MVLQTCQQIQLHETKCQGATGGQTTIVTPPYQKVGSPSYEVAEQNPVTTSSYKMLEVPWVLEMFSHQLPSLKAQARPNWPPWSAWRGVERLP